MAVLVIVIGYQISYSFWFLVLLETLSVCSDASLHQYLDAKFCIVNLMQKTASRYL